jgi:hypothetical protein
MIRNRELSEITAADRLEMAAARARALAEFERVNGIVPTVADDDSDPDGYERERAEYASMNHYGRAH